MKMLKNLSICLLLVLVAQFGFAQETAPKATKDKPTTITKKTMLKEMKRLMKVLPQESLVEVLEFAKVNPDRSTKVQKELKGVLKELSGETLKEVLNFAQAKEVAMSASESLAEAAPNWKDEEKPANPNTTVSKPAQLSLPSNPNSFTEEKKEEPKKHPAQVARELAESLPKTDIEFDEEIYDFGQIKQGDVVEHTFKFRNVGSAPLSLTYVKPSCGCTAPKWSKEPVAPGKTGEIQIKFNSAHKKGPQNKSVTIFLNAEPVTKILRFKGEVVVE